MKLPNLKLWQIIICWTITILLCSCSARKAEKTRTSETIKTEIKTEAVIAKTEDTNIKKTEKTTVDDKNETTTKETVYEPIDPTKPAITTDPDGTKTILNNSKKTTRETTHKNNTKTDNFIETAIKSTSEVLEKIKTELRPKNGSQPETRPEG